MSVEITTDNTMQKPMEEFVTEKPATEEIVQKKDDIPLKPLIVYDSKNRFALLDNARGLVMLLLSFAVVMYPFDVMPYFFGHVGYNTNGIGFADFGVTAFVFILCMMMSYNFRRDLAKKGAKAIIKTYIVRSVALVGASFIIGYFQNLGDSSVAWGILATYGVASLLLLPFMPIKKPEIRFGIGLGILFLYQIVVTATWPAFNNFVLGHGDGGFVGVISYLGLMLICTSLGELYFNNKKRFYILSIIISGLALLLFILNVSIGPIGQDAWKTGTFISYIFMSKPRQSMAYMIISLAVVMGFFILADRWKYLREKQVPILGAIGKNALLFFVAGGLLRIVAYNLVGMGIEGDIRNVVGAQGVWLMIACLAIVIIPLIAMAYLFQRFKVRLSF